MRNRNGAPRKLQLYGRPAAAAAASRGRRVDVGRTRGARAMALAAIADDNAADAHMKRFVPGARARTHTLARGDMILFPRDPDDDEATI